MLKEAKENPCPPAPKQSISFTFAVASSNTKLHIAQVFIIEHICGSLSDGGSCCLPVSWNSHDRFGQLWYLWTTITIGSKLFL